jgi:4,5-DOPA dioxygenase extradiol
MTHGLQYLRDWSIDAKAPGWSSEFDTWAAERLAKGDIDAAPETLIEGFWMGLSKRSLLVS